MPGKPYRTLDGSMITELIRPETDGSMNLSVAEAVIEPGQSTLPHYHRNTEEVYYVLHGEGLLTSGGRHEPIAPGQAHLIGPGVEHSVTCVGQLPLKILCLCAPAYDHDDTVVTGQVLV